MFIERLVNQLGQSSTWAGT